MLKEKIDEMNRIHAMVEPAYEVIEIIRPLKSDIERVCAELKKKFDEGKLVNVDEEIKAALLSVYKVLETANACLSGEAVSPLFE